jgi:hypothetical protein
LKAYRNPSVLRNRHVHRKKQPFVSNCWLVLTFILCFPENMQTDVICLRPRGQYMNQED